MRLLFAALVAAFFMSTAQAAEKCGDTKEMAAAYVEAYGAPTYILFIKEPEGDRSILLFPDFYLEIRSKDGVSCVLKEGGAWGLYRMGQQGTAI